MVMGPSVMPALLRTVRLGYVTLALEEKAGQIGKLLGATRQEMLRMDDVLEKLSRNAGAMGKTIEDARRRTRAVGRKLQEVELPGPTQAEEIFELEETSPDRQDSPLPLLAGEEGGPRLNVGAALGR
jgi:DNA recombination protein RmuC